MISCFKIHLFPHTLADDIVAYLETRGYSDLVWMGGGDRPSLKTPTHL